MAKNKKFGKNISRLLYNTSGEKSRFNTSGLTLTEMITDNNPNNPIQRMSDLPKIKNERYKGE